MEFLSPDYLIQYGGLSLLVLIIFAETGLFVGFFLPGDSLLFVAGVLCDSSALPTPVLTVWLLLVIAAVLGSQAGFYFGKRVALFLEHRKESFFIKKRHLTATHEFYKKHKITTFIIGRFLPIIRTFMPIVAGVVNIEQGKFFLYNVMGAVLWISFMLFSGYGLGQVFPEIKNYLGVITIGLVIVTTVIVVVNFRKVKEVGKGTPKITP